MGIIPRLIVMMRNRRLADIQVADYKKQLAKQASLEKKRQQEQMLAALNVNPFEDSPSFDLSSLLRD